MIDLKIVIPIQPITKKNHQEIRKNFKTGRRFIAQSKAYEQYEQDCRWFINPNTQAIDYPVNVKCLYYMGTKRSKIDLSNLMAATHDILVKFGVLEDDGHTIIKSVDGSRVLYDKENPRTEIYITDYKE